MVNTRVLIGSLKEVVNDDIGKANAMLENIVMNVTGNDSFLVTELKDSQYVFSVNGIDRKGEVSDLAKFIDTHLGLNQCEPSIVKKELDRVLNDNGLEKLGDLDFGLIDETVFNALKESLDSQLTLVSELASLLPNKGLISEDCQATAIHNAIKEVDHLIEGLVLSDLLPNSASGKDFEMITLETINDALEDSEDVGLRR